MLDHREPKVDPLTGKGRLTGHKPGTEMKDRPENTDDVGAGVFRHFGEEREKRAALGKKTLD